MSRPWIVAFKIVLLVATIVAMLSLGGLLMYVFPILAIGHWCSARNSRPFEWYGWIFLSSLAGAEWGWETAYTLTDGNDQWIWIGIAVAASLTAIVLSTTTHRRSMLQTSED
jgi:hypothetical protein